MALVTIKILKKIPTTFVRINADHEVIMQRKPALELQRQKFVEVGRVLDPRKPADKPLVDAWLEANPVVEKTPKKAKK